MCLLLSFWRETLPPPPLSWAALSFRAHCVNTKKLQSTDINKVSVGIVPKI